MNAQSARLKTPGNSRSAINRPGACGVHGFQLWFTYCRKKAENRHERDIASAGEARYSFSLGAGPALILKENS